MALQVEPIRYDQGYLEADKRGLLISRNPLDLSRLTSVDDLILEGIQPAGTNRRLLLRWGEKWMRWVGTAFAEAPTQSLTVESILSEGNDVTELDALAAAQLTPLAGQQVHVAVALSAPYSGPYPTLRFSAVGKSNQEITVKDEISPVISLSPYEPVEILKVTPETQGLAGGSVTVTVERDGTGIWEGTDAVAGRKAQRIRLKATMNAPTVGTSEAVVTKITVRHKSDAGSAVATGRASIIGITHNFRITQTQAHLMVMRPDIQDTHVEAFLSLRPTPVRVDNEILGTGDGAQHTYTLAHPALVAPHTVTLWWDDVQKAMGTDYAFSSETGQITCTAPVGAAVRVKYEHNWQPEEWRPMNHDQAYVSERDPGLVNDQFQLAVSPEQGGGVSSIRIDLVQDTGTVTGERIGTATGITQAHAMAHLAKRESIVVKAVKDGTSTTLPQSAWSYSPISRVLQVVGPVGAELFVDYAWQGQQPWVENFACVWNQ